MAAKGETKSRFADKSFYSPNSLEIHDQWPLELYDMVQKFLLCCVFLITLNILLLF